MSKRKDAFKGCKVVITNHAIQRFLERSENMSEEKFYELLNQSKTGNKIAEKRIKKVREELELKFRNSSLKKFMKDGAEMRYELSGSMNKRCTFVAYKNGNKFTVVTAYLQGKKKDYWKNEGVVKHA